MTIHLKLRYAVFLLVLASAPRIAQADAENWTTPDGIGGEGVRGCDATRIENAVLSQCKAWANRRSDTDYEYVIEDVHWYNGSSIDREGPSWDHWHKCSWSATYQCGYRRVPLK